MRAEQRWATNKQGQRFVRGVVLISENRSESEMLDSLSVDTRGIASDGLIDTLVAEVRLSDGYGQHYVYLRAAAQEHPEQDTLI